MARIDNKDHRNIVEYDRSKHFKDTTVSYWENIDEEEFRKIFKNSAVKRTKFSGLKRNVLLAKEQTQDDL